MDLCALESSCSHHNCALDPLEQNVLLAEKLCLFMPVQLSLLVCNDHYMIPTCLSMLTHSDYTYYTSSVKEAETVVNALREEAIYSFARRTREPDSQRKTGRPTDRPRRSITSVPSYFSTSLANVRPILSASLVAR